jgi:hypothetical protein
VAALVTVALGFAVFYLFEENAFLHARQADPTLQRAPGWRHEFLNEWQLALAFLIMSAVLYSIVSLFRQPGLLATLKELLRRLRDPDLPPRPLPLGDRMRAFAIGAGLVLTGSGVMLLGYTIQAHVWEGEWLAHLLGIYFGMLFVVEIWRLVVRDYRLVHYGAPPSTDEPQLTPDQVAAIRAALEEGWLRDWHTARKLYREAVPDASDTEVECYLVRLMGELGAQHPGKFVLPPLSLANINWKGALICALIEAVLVGVVWYIIAPSHPVTAAFWFAWTFLLAVVVLTVIRAMLWSRGPKRKSRMLMVAFFLWLAIGSLISPPYWPSWSTALSGLFSVILGFWCGLALMVCGLYGEVDRAQKKLASRS